MGATTHRPVWIDDADPIFRRGMVACLRAEDFPIAGESSGLEPEPVLSNEAVLVFDVDGVGLARPTALARRHAVRLIGIVRDRRAETLYDTVSAGLAGVLLRDELTPSRLTSCVRSVEEGNGSLPPDLLGKMLAGLAKGAPRGAAGGELARREVDVLQLLAQGGTTREIAERLSYSERTVKNIVHDVLVKLNCRTRAHAVALGARQGLI